jgi:hypothetical protein
MKPLRLLRSAALLAALAGPTACHFDALFNAPDSKSGAVPPGGGLVFTTAPTQAAAGQAITPAIVVTIEDASGHAVTSFAGPVTVRLGANPSGGTLMGDTTATAAQGVASFSNLRIDKAASGYTLRAVSGSLPSATTSAFTVTPGAATRLLFSVQPSSTMLDGIIRPPVQVTAYDGQGNVATNFSGVITVAKKNDGSVTKDATLSGGGPATAVAGVVTFSALSLNRVGTGYTLSAAFANGVTESAPFDITATPPPPPGNATQLAFTQEPQSSSAGAPLAPVQVTALDAQGQRVAGFSGPVTVTLGANPGGAALSNGGPVNAVNGVATFTSLSVNRTGTGYTLRAAAGGLPTLTSTPFDIAPGPATQLAFTVQPSNALPGAAITPPVQVTAFDALGNAATNFTGDVWVAIGHDASLLGATLGGHTHVPAAAGVAAFGDLSINQPGVGYTLTAAFVPGTPVTTSASFTILVP